MTKRIDIKRKFYTMSSGEDGNEAEIIMYGEIVETQPIDWWTREPIQGEYIIQKEFLEDLTKVSECKKINIRINSLGGDAGVSILIHNRLRELVQNGAEITCIVDGVAMSGGSLIICACDKVQVNPSSIIMIHKCWGQIYGGYNADELRELAKTYDAWDKAQISIYSRKCKLSETIISHMMAETTYMTGKEAIEKGFADELIEDYEPLSVAASTSRTSIFANGHKLRLPHGMIVPESIPTVSGSDGEQSENTKQSKKFETNEGGKIMAKNLNELRDENPELAAAVECEIKAAIAADNIDAINRATEAERNRLAEIDEIARLYDDKTVREAKYGEHPCTAQEMAFKAATRAAKSGATFMQALISDYKASGVDEIAAIPGEEFEVKSKTTNQKVEEARLAIGSLLNQKKNGD